jgi:hypothetical protein
MITEFEKEVFEFLEDLRKSGITNMFGATPYIMEEFDLEKRHARNLLIKWMEKK